MSYKQKSFLTPQYGLFIDRHYDEKCPYVFKMGPIDGLLDWRISIWGLQIGIWIERVDK